MTDVIPLRQLDISGKKQRYVRRSISLKPDSVPVIHTGTREKMKPPLLNDEALVKTRLYDNRSKDFYDSNAIMSCPSKKRSVPEMSVAERITSPSSSALHVLAATVGHRKQVHYLG